MSSITDTTDQQSYWSTRYQEKRTGWDIGSAATPLRAYIDQLTDKEQKILIPGAGNSYEAEYLWQKGFEQTYILDIAKEPLAAFQQRVPSFPSQQIIESNFFTYQGQYDLIFEQTFFCSFPPTASNRQAYANQMHQLLKTGGKLVGLWFDIPLTGDLEKRPFGGTKTEYLSYFEPLFTVKTFAPCYNSIPPRAGSEWFAIFEKG